MRWCYVPAGCVAAKYPGRVAMCCGLAVVVTCGQPADGFIERWWEVNRQACQIDRHRVGGDRYLVPGQGGDVFGALGEDDDQDRGEAVTRMESLLVGDLFDDGVLFFDRHPWCGSAAVRCQFQIRIDELGLDGPSDESQDVLAGGGPVDCQRSMWAWVSWSTVVLCSAASQLQNSIVTVVARARLASGGASVIEGAVTRRDGLRSEDSAASSSRSLASYQAAWGLTAASAKIGERCLQCLGWPAAHRRAENHHGSLEVPTRSRGRVHRLR
jgi:hypothetical protein